MLCFHSLLAFRQTSHWFTIPESTGFGLDLGFFFLTPCLEGQLLAWLDGGETVLGLNKNKKKQLPLSVPNNNRFRCFLLQGEILLNFELFNKLKIISVLNKISQNKSLLADFLSKNDQPIFKQCAASIYRNAGACLRIPTKSPQPLLPSTVLQ